MLLLAALAFGGWVSALPGGSEPPAVVSAVAPVYPAIAVAARASGEVMVEVEIDTEGSVTATNSDGKIKLLSRVAEEAARRWRFAPARSGEKTRKVRLGFLFRLMPEEAASLDSTPIFYPPYRIEVREKPVRMAQTHPTPRGVE